MLEINRKLLVEEKTKDLVNGYSAYADTDELIRLIQRNVAELDLDVIKDQTDIGCWFIPNK
ncbi:hypothetical protein [Salirhabdus sp. Marseille-P4669]|uniref:hypothetical protein n=1 Tax=Salirhabdus sp. Marseille-P4669 TaxID=2042310 RepID=UPI000C7A1F0B|nr:hypothetical protein [Salirhabdus sp. Marseille-P4669]